jgi:hypothetical protein
MVLNHLFIVSNLLNLKLQIYFPQFQFLLVKIYFISYFRLFSYLIYLFIKCLIIFLYFHLLFLKYFNSLNFKKCFHCLLIINFKLQNINFRINYNPILKLTNMIKKLIVIWSYLFIFTYV